MNTREHPVAAFLTGCAVTGCLAGLLYAIGGPVAAGVFLAIVAAYAVCS